MGATPNESSYAMNTGMLICRPPAEVFNAFVDPAVTRRFWFTRGSGRMEPGKQLQWEWEMYGVSVPVTVKVVEAPTRIVIEWPAEPGVTTVEWTFRPWTNGATFVNITERGFTGDAAALVKKIADSTEGFTLVLAGLKALLEHGCELNLVRDRFPKGIDAA